MLVEYYQLPIQSRISKPAIILVLLLVIAAVVAILFSSFLPHSLAGTLTITLTFGIITLISYSIARSIGLDKLRSSKQKRVTTLLCSGFASFFGYATLTVFLLGHPFRFPPNLPLLLAIVLAATLTALIADGAQRSLARTG